jgi:hypothetical protein
LKLAMRSACGRKATKLSDIYLLFYRSPPPPPDRQTDSESTECARNNRIYTKISRKLDHPHTVVFSGPYVC